MILLALALAAQPLWTGPRTEEYKGPGTFCGGGYAVRLANGDRALILPQGQAPQATRVVMAGREVNIMTGAQHESGRVVLRAGGVIVTEQDDGGTVTYIVTDETPYGLRVASDAFRGFKKDGWFFSHANFRDGADEGMNCLSAYSN
ncbi:MAG: hypothetical protein ACJ8EO_08180 [Sphingomicrobium sp.]